MQRSHIGDRIGRKKTLVTTFLLMGVSTVMIGLLPDYDTLGIAAPILLVTFRIMQGIGLGGEWGGALLLAYECAPKEKRGLYGSIPQIGLTIGLLLASFFMAAMTTLPLGRKFQCLGMARTLGFNVGDIYTFRFAMVSHHSNVGYFVF